MTVSSATIVCSCAAAQRALIATTTVLSSRSVLALGLRHDVLFQRSPDVDL